MINLILWLIGTMIVVLGPIILIHELGHFLSAKRAGVRVEEFGLGYPPRMLKVWRGKGYLILGSTKVIIPANFRMPPGIRLGAVADLRTSRNNRGEFILTSARALVDPAEEEARFHSQPVEGGLRLQGEITTLEPGTIYSLNWLPLGGFVKMTGEEDPSDPMSLAAKSSGWRAVVLGSGVVLNIAAAIILFTLAFMSGRPELWWSQIADVAPGSPAAAIGLAPGDIVMRIDGQSMASEAPNEALIEYTQSHLGQEMTLEILRDTQVLELRATPRTEWPPDQGPLGISLRYTPSKPDIRRLPVGSALGQAFRQIGAIIQSIVSLPFRAAAGTTVPGEARPVSIIIILEILVLSLKTSIDWRLWYPILEQAALMSLALGVTNLLPLPGLDGGRLLFVLVEAIRGRRVSPERESVVHVIGMLIMVVLMLAVMVYDFANPLISWDVMKEWLK
ncbi:MAG: site-2 protease family protein [Chloroflexi bacterium]|nr:site-2 protease family protein [Chloroflexota bacterium]